ncbi:hypothetical protein B0H17DRAFT_1179932 [Mycena rosella]|uniref:Uncharacterized protein n=1 Tax=Mycena rosella TaxID=1033263 RepID=A0AAD7GGZ6_MYCRO|nr:hypothetical protein B0H17DRAFT_1179932 [Mycena rosella]
MATETGAGSKHTPADRKYFDTDSLSARLLMEFRNYVFSPTYIALNAAKFLDHEWVDMELLHEFLQQPAHNFTPDASMTRQSVSDSVRIKIEATPSLAPVPVPPTLVKAEPRVASVPRASANVKMRTLHEGGREVFELLSDSEPEADDSDLEVLEALQHTSRSSSAIPLPDPKQFLDDNSDSAEPDTRSESSDEENGSDLIKSDTVWLDDGTSLARIGPFRPTRKMTVARMERTGRRRASCRGHDVSRFVFVERLRLRWASMHTRPGVGASGAATGDASCYPVSRRIAAPDPSIDNPKSTHAPRDPGASLHPSLVPSYLSPSPHLSVPSSLRRPASRSRPTPPAPPFSSLLPSFLLTLASHPIPSPAHPIPFQFRRCFAPSPHRIADALFSLQQSHRNRNRYNNAWACLVPFRCARLCGPRYASARSAPRPVRGGRRRTRGRVPAARISSQARLFMRARGCFVQARNEVLVLVLWAELALPRPARVHLGSVRV